jgi:hypothetical protein
MKKKGFSVSFNSLINNLETIGNKNTLLVWSLILILIMAAVTSAVFFIVFRHVDSTNALLSSAASLGLAAAFYLVYRFVRSERLRSKFCVLFFVLTLFFIIWRYYLQIGPAVWTVAFSIIILATISDNRLMLRVMTFVCYLSALFYG